MGRIRAINLAAVPGPSHNPEGIATTGIVKQPTARPVLLRAPGAKTTGLGSGVVGDRIIDTRHHGGHDQAVYAYAREDYDWWEERLGRALPGGLFGENLTTEGVDVNGALVGERWRIGEAVLEAVLPRIPCKTFAARIGEPQWIKRFTERARPGAYLRVVAPGYISAGDEVTVAYRPGHDLSIAELFRALTTEPELLPKIVEVQEVPAGLRAKTRQRLGG
jgi:MOSC domain-containing protein YiiM